MPDPNQYQNRKPQPLISGLDFNLPHVPKSGRTSFDFDGYVVVRVAGGTRKHPNYTIDMSSLYRKKNEMTLDDPSWRPKQLAIGTHASGEVFLVMADNLPNMQTLEITYGLVGHTMKISSKSAIIKIFKALKESLPSGTCDEVKIYFSLIRVEGQSLPMYRVKPLYRTVVDKDSKAHTEKLG